MNPLDRVGEVFQLSLANPNPKAARLKDGPRYRVEFEIDAETFEQFMAARELGGMVIEAHATVTALNNPMTASSPAARAEGVGANAADGQTKPRTPGNALAAQLHRDGYFRNPNLWNRLHQRGIYTLVAHKERIEALPCLFSMLREPEWRKTQGVLLRELDVSGWHVLLQGRAFGTPCSGDVCLHHVAGAAVPAAGREQPGAPRKVPHFYGVPLCHEHHANWAHSKYATREEKEKLREVAVALTAYAVKAAVKRYIRIESLREITRGQLDAFEREIGLGG